MASITKRQFLSRWIYRHVRDARVYPEFKERLNAEIARTVPQCGISRKERRTRKWHAMVSAAIATPESAFYLGCDTWERKKRGKRVAAKAGRIAGAEVMIENRKPNFQEELEKQLAEVRLTKEVAKARARASLQATWQRKGLEREQDLRLKEQLKKVEVKEAYVKWVEKSLKDKERKEMRDKEEKEAQVVDVVVEEQGQVDLVRDVEWVYRNLADLILVSESGVRRLDPTLLKKAPSNGAIAIAQYARDNPSGFLEKFILRIMPKVEQMAPQESEAELMEKLDPAFEDLAKFFKE
jgi:hypothetical protein